MTLFDQETIDFIDIATMYTKHGLPPIQGGTLDQAWDFIVAARFVASEIARYDEQTS